MLQSRIFNVANMYFNAIREKKTNLQYKSMYCWIQGLFEDSSATGHIRDSFFYDESFYKFERIIEELIKRITKCYKRVGYDMDIM